MPKPTDAKKVLEMLYGAPKPAVSRLDMNFKDVTKRMPELQQAAKLYEQGKITREQYYAIVDQLKPVTPYDFVPKPATAEEALAALSSDKAKNFGRTDLLVPGETVMSRLDIPAYSTKGVFVTSQHRHKPPADEPKTIYTPTMVLEGETKMLPGTKAAAKVARGEADKSSFATIRGAYKPVSDEEALEMAIDALRRKEFAQIGYDPERRGHFYDRRTMEPIIGTEEGIIQIGPLVLGKKPVRGKPEDFEYKEGGAVHMQDGGSPLDQFAAKSRGVSSLPGYGEGAQDIQQALAAIQESPAGRIASGVGELAEGYMSGAGSTDLQKIGQGLSMIPMLGLPATVSKTIKTARVGDAITDSLRAKYPNVDISVIGDDKLHLSKIVVPKDQRNQGLGTQVMDDLVKQADDVGATVTLSPSADFGGNKERLKDFYKRFGFVQNKGRNKDFTIWESMYRAPQENLPTNFSDLGAMATQAYADYKANPNQLNALRYQRIKKAADDAYVKTQATPSKPVVTDEDYRGLHTAPTRASGAPLHALTQTYPDDIYSSKASQYYGHGEPRDAAVVSLAQSFKGRPHQMVTVYRAVPKNAKGSINAGDWVTIDRPYAKSHGESALRGDYKILSKRVRANEIFTNGDSIYEWGYDPVEAIKKAAGGAIHMQDGGDPTQMFNFNPMAAKAAKQKQMRESTPETPLGALSRGFASGLFGNIEDPVPYTGSIMEGSPQRQQSQANLREIGRNVGALTDIGGMVTPFTKPAAQAVTRGATALGKAGLEQVDRAMFGEGPLAALVAPVAPMNVNAPVSKLGFYNPIEETATTLQRKQGPGQAFLNEFTRAGISKQRLEDAGLAQKLAATPNVTREEVQAMTKGTMPDVEEVVLSRSVVPPYMKGFANLHMPNLNVNDSRQVYELRRIANERYKAALEANDLDAAEFAMKAEEDITKFNRTHSHGTKPGERLTEFHEYQEPGGKNYREVLLKAPVKRISKEEARRVLNAKPDARLTDYDIEYASRLSSPEFRSAHWSDPNVISHIRMNDRVDADNKNVLFIEELQSDWAQEGRKKGFGKDVPQGPFVKNTNEWVDLSLKNIIKRAVDEGYDRVAFIDGYKSFLRFPQGADGESTEAGMRKFYDEIVPGRLKALVGKDNVRTIPGITQQRPLDVSLQGDRYYVVDADTDIAIPDHPGFRSLERAEQYLDELYSKTKSMEQIGFDITPEIREKFSKPIPYKKGGAVKRVHISDNPDTMLLELTRAPRMQEGGKLPPGVRRAMAQQRGTVAPIPGIKTPAEFIGGYVGAEPRFSVMDPDAEALERAYRAGEATSVIGDIVGSISPFATASTLARANALPGAAVVKGTAKKAFTARELKSETNKVAKAIAKDNPKMKPEDVQKRAATIAEKNLTWTKEQKPELEKTYGELVQAPASASVGERLQNVPEVVSQRAKKAEEFLAQPTEPWQPPRPELQAFDRAMIKDAMEGFPGIEQTAFPRYMPPKADLSYIEEIYQDPRNRALIEAQIKRGLPLGGETFYASLYPMKMAALERGIPEEKFNQFIYSTAPASARNSIMNEMAVGQFLRDMNARGLPLDEETVKREMAAFKEKYGKGLPLMPIHREGVKNVLEGNLDLREQLKADIPTNYKIPTYGTQKAGDFGKSVVLDVHEASGQTQGSRFHPYFSEQGGFGSREYGAAEQQMMDIAKGLGLPGGTAQAGRWFGGGELTGLVSPRGDALDLLERQAAYTLNGMGIKPTPRNVRNYLLDMIDTGEGVLMPYYSKNVPMPDVRTEKKKGGAVKKSALDSVKRGYKHA